MPLRNAPLTTNNVHVYIKTTTGIATHHIYYTVLEERELTLSAMHTSY